HSYRSDVDASELRLRGAAEVYEVFLVGQKRREAVRKFVALRVELGQRRRYTAGRGHLHQRTRAVSEDDDVVFIPSASGPALWCIAKGRGRAARDVHFLQLAVLLKPDEAAICGPEWNRILRPGSDLAGLQRIERSDPDGFTLAGGGEQQVAS